jgi:hypothetical protein
MIRYPNLSEISMSTMPPAPDLLNDALRSISQRMDFTPGKYLIQQHALPVSIGWDSTINRACAAAKTRPDLGKIQAALTKSFFEHTLVGEKLVMYYGFAGLSVSVKKTHSDDVTRAVAQLAIPDSSFRDVFPLAIYDRDQLRSLESSGPVLTAVFSLEGQICFLFSSVRSFNERVPVDTTQFTEQDREQLSDYSEIIGVRAIRRQCFDYVVYDSSRELVEVRIDCPDGMPGVQKSTALQKVIAGFNQLNVFSSGWSPFGVAPINFHSLMDNLYRTGTEGSVFQLGFAASTAKTSSNNGARLLRKKNFDLRRDDFHIGGTKHVKDVSVYTIGVEWPSDIPVSRPTVIVPGSVSMLYKPPITFPELYVRGCLNSVQYALLTEKIDKYRQ